MIDTGSRMIRAGGGRVKVLRPTISAAGIWLFQYEAYIGPGTCRPVRLSRRVLLGERAANAV